MTESIRGGSSGRDDARSRAARKKRIALWSLGTVLALSIALPLGGYALHALGAFGTEAIAQSAGGADLPPNPRSEYWRAVNEGVAGYSAVSGPGANILIERGGTDWQMLRDGPVADYVPWVIVAVMAVLLAFHLVFGRQKLEDKPLSGRKLKRWGWFDRLVHWTTAVSFIALAITGLSMLIGKAVLIPLLGKAGFALWAETAITVHNVVGPVFSVGVSLMIVLWVWYNFPAKHDWTWLKMGGGMFSKDGHGEHPPAGRMNAGEKLWFWFVASVGILVCLSGYVLVAPVFGWTVPFLDTYRPEMRVASIVHAVLAIGWTAAALGHIYIGTAGTEGAFEGMSTGYCSEEWAQQHHNLWYDEMAAQGRVIPAGADPAAASEDSATITGGPDTGRSVTAG